VDEVDQMPLPTPICAVVYRGTGRSGFAVQLHDSPGVLEIVCSTIDSTPGVAEFDRRVRLIRSTNEASLLRVSVVLGEYCLARRAFINCHLTYPCEAEHLVTEEAWNPLHYPLESAITPKAQPPAEKRKRFISSSQSDLYLA
jgi:hypothetical protein